MIAQVEIANEIERLSVANFDIVVGFLLNDIMQRNAVNINGKGDGGVDFKSFQSECDHCWACQYGDRYGAEIIQVTVQNQQWKQKAIRDAEKAKKNYKNMSYYWFFTSKKRESVELSNLEESIKEKTQIYDVKCMGANEIAGYIFQSHTFPQLMLQLGRPIHDNIVGRPDNRLRFLHSLYAFHGVRDDLRKEMYDAVILSLLSQGAMTRESLVEEATQFLSRPTASEEMKRRIDSLSVKGRICKEGRELKLSDECKMEVDAANICYEKGLDDLKNGVDDVLRKYVVGASLSTEVVLDLAIDLAKFFASNQSALINRTSKSTVVPFPDVLDIKKSVNTLLIEHGINRNVDIARDELVALASKNLLVMRLVNAVTYAWMEYQPNNCAIIAAGQYNWTKLEVVLDANVAIPYLLSKWFGKTFDDCSDAVSTAIDTLQSKGCLISIPNVYLSECAGHLVRALKFLPVIEGNERILKSSENAFVAHYCQMFEMGNGECPTGFALYIKNMCNRVFEYASDMKEAKNYYFNEIKNKFLNNVNISSFPSYKTSLTEENCNQIRNAYTDELQSVGRIRGMTQVDHDVVILEDLLYRSTTTSKILLTSDRVVASVFDKKVAAASNNLVLTPGEVCDILQLSGNTGLNDMKLRSLALTYATVGNSQDLIACKFFDQLMECANANDPLWKQTEKINVLKEKFFESHLDITSGNVEDKQVRATIQGFLVEQGLVEHDDSDDDVE